jgi:hypothetical protein
MTIWRQPQAGEKGFCRVRPHKSKAWESGYSIVRWKDSDPSICFVEKAGSTFLEWVPVSNIEVPI